MSELGGEMGQTEQKEVDLGSNSNAATCCVASRPLASSLVKWGMTWEDDREVRSPTATPLIPRQPLLKVPNISFL